MKYKVRLLKMVRLCEFCRNCMKFDPEGFNKCDYCGSRQPISTDDTILLQNSRARETDQFVTYLQYGNKDPTIKRSKNKCPKCDTHYGVTHLGNDEKTILICDCKSESSNTLGN